MKASDFLPPEHYLSTEELVEEGPTIFTVARAERRHLNSQWSENDPKGTLVVIFTDNRIWIVRGSRAIAEAFDILGPESDDWPGRRLRLEAVFWKVKDGENKYYIKASSVDDLYYRSGHYARKPKPKS